MEAIYFLIAIIGLILLVKLFSWPFKILIKLILNAFLGVILLLLVNTVGTLINITIPVNPISALVAGFFGVPGVIFLIIFKNM